VQICRLSGARLMLAVVFHMMGNITVRRLKRPI
jgi:hypothetical protein